MEAALLFFPAGLIVNLVIRLIKKWPTGLRLTAVFFSSVLSCGICWTFGATRLPGFFFPDWMIVVFGLFAGGMIFWAHEKRFFTESGLRYSATILLAVIHSGLLFGINWLVSSAFIRSQPSFLISEGLTLLLLGFLFFFGFAFPERFFKKR
jgi:hypothetical protein